MAFVDPKMAQWLTPPRLDSQLWIGLLGAVTFGLTLIQFKADWRGRSEAHQRSFTMYAEVKREAGYFLTTSIDIPAKDFQRLVDRYDMASDVGSGIPEQEFLPLKQHHKMKIEISRLIDEKPGAFIWLAKIKLFLRDNR